MKFKIAEAKELALKVLTKNGFAAEEAEYCVENCLEAELTGKKTHGFIRVSLLVKQLREGRIKSGGEEISVIKETQVSLLIDGHQKTGLYVINRALEMGIQKVKSSGLLIVGVSNTALISGMIGQYARKAAENNLIFIGFNNSSGALVPYGSIKAILGTNPFTVGIPTNGFPVILDMSSSIITKGHLITAIAEGKKIVENIAIDKEGNMTTDPTQAMEGGLLPIASHKGSGIALIVEILAGALTNSRCGSNVEGGWGTLFFLIDPNILRPINDFKNDVESLIVEIKESPKMKGFSEIYYPGEKSQELREKNLKKGEIEINDELYKSLINLLG